MARNLTQAQLKRRGAILEWLRGLADRNDPWRATPAIRGHVAQYHSIFVTEDTIAKDLKALAEAGSLKQDELPFTHGKRIWAAA